MKRAVDVETTLSNYSIDKNTPVPLYYQLQSIILNEISSGVLQPGDCIPTELQLSEMFNLSRTTVRQAVLGLVMEGKLHRVKGKGTFVSQPKIMQDFMRKVESYDDQMTRLGLKAKTKLLEIAIVEAPSSVKQIFGNDEHVIRINRLRYADDDPIVIVLTYLPRFCSSVLQEDLNTTRLYDFLARTDRTRIQTVTRQIEAVAAGKSESELLMIPTGSPIQLTTTIGRSSVGEPIEYSIAHYRGDKNKFVVELQA